MLIKVTLHCYPDRLLQHVADWKSRIAEKFPDNKKIIFVGVHCRRTDYDHHYRVVSGGSLVDHVYFNKAFEIYR